MDWQKDGADWSMNQLSRFSFVRPYNWHIQDTQAIDKPILLLLHGTGASTHSWRLLITILKENFRVIAIDLPGHGFTKISNSARSGLEMMAEDILALLIEEKIRPDLLMGHSAGAALAFRLALDIKSGPIGVISVNGVLDHYFDGLSGFLFPIAAKVLSLNPFSSRFIASVNKITNQTKKLSEMTGSKIDEQNLKFYNKLFSDPNHLSGTLAMMSQWKLKGLNNDLPHLKQKTLFLIGKNDRMVSPDSLINYTKKVKGSIIKTEENLGHLMHEEAPNIIYKHVINFYKTIQS